MLLRAVDRVLTFAALAGAVLLVVLLVTGPGLIGAEAEPAAAGGAPAAAGAPAASSGEEVFVANCGSCHTLAAAGTTGSAGPNLDDAAPSAAEVESIVSSGSGIMPSFEGSLSAEEISAVAAFVAGG